MVRQLKDRVVGLIDRYKSQVDFLAIRLERSHGTDIFLRSGKVETLSTGIIGGQVRVCHRGGWGFASFNGKKIFRLFCVFTSLCW
jgi:TldD protein